MITPTNIIDFIRKVLKIFSDDQHVSSNILRQGQKAERVTELDVFEKRSGSFFRIEPVTNAGANVLHGCFEPGEEGSQLQPRDEAVFHKSLLGAETHAKVGAGVGVAADSLQRNG